MTMTSMLMLRHGKNAPWRSLTESLHQQGFARRTMAFKPRRTPPPSIAGVNLRARPNPQASLLSTPKSSDQKRGGEGHKEGWVSPWHEDHYERFDDRTVDNPELLHGDPHMPIQQFANGEGKVVLDPFGGKATELNDYNKAGQKNALVADFDDEFNRVMGGDDEADFEDDVDELEREFGSDAADAIRQHLNQFHKRINAADMRGTNTYSPLDEVEENLRTIDRMTAAEGTTEDLALRRRARSEGREFFRLGTIPKLGEGTDESGEGGNDNIEKEFGKGRGFDADSVFGKSSKVHYPYGKQWPTPTYHPDFPTGTNIGDNPNDVEEEKWMHELNRLIQEEQSREMELGEIDETYTPINPQKDDMDAYMKERRRTAKYRILENEEEHEKTREEKPDEILEMIKNGEDPNQEAFGPWYVFFSSCLTYKEYIILTLH